MAGASVTSSGNQRRETRHMKTRSIGFKLLMMAATFVVVVATLLSAFGGALYLMSGVRAYVRAEALFTNAQKDAVFYLDRYVRSGAQSDYSKFKSFVRIPLGDRHARLELIKPDYDYQIAYREFLRGGSHPNDAPSMIFMFRHFGKVGHFKDAITFWAGADEQVAALDTLGEKVHKAYKANNLSANKRKYFLDEIERINTLTTPMEIQFSIAMTQGARWIRTVLTTSIGLMALALLAGGLLFAWWLSRGILAAIRDIEDGVAKVSKGDLNHRIPVSSNDELGHLTQAFNDMVRQRREAGINEERHREFLSTVVENLAEGVIACDERGNVSLFNRATREFYGLPPEAVPAERWAEYYALYEADGTTVMAAATAPLTRAFAGERIDNQEMVIATPKLPERHIVASGQPILASDGRKLGAVVAMHDITDLKRTEREILEHVGELARSNAELEQFAYVASHDLQEPLRTVTSYTQLLDRRYRAKLDEGATEYFEFINSAVHRMRDQINGLLEYSKVSRNTNDPQSTDLNQLLDAAVASLELAIDDQRAKITHDDLPTLTVYPAQLGQVFQNLLANALKFRGDAPPVVHVGCKETAQGWEITVSDNGIGVSPEHADRIFKLYQRLHTHDQYPGNGIGLALCRKIVERHSGKIWLTPGNPGAVFHFTLLAQI